MRLLSIITLLILSCTISASPVHLITRSEGGDGLAIAVCSCDVNDEFYSNCLLVETSAMLCWKKDFDESYITSAMEFPMASVYASSNWGVGSYTGMPFFAVSIHLFISFWKSQLAR